MGLIISVTVTCDKCGADTGSSHEEAREALLHAERGGWKVNRLAQDVYFGRATCEDCLAGDA